MHACVNMYYVCMYVCMYVRMYVCMYVSFLMRATFPANLIFKDLTTLITGLYVIECEF